MSRLERMAALFEKDHWGTIPSHWFSIAAQIQQGTTGPEQWSEEDYEGAKSLLAVWRSAKCRHCTTVETEDRTLRVFHQDLQPRLSP